jgi:hypothetical protein
MYPGIKPTPDNVAPKDRNHGVSQSHIQIINKGYMKSKKWKNQ